MKKVLSLLFALCFAVSTYGQEEHLKFMGIPLNGTINSFQNKLVAKGFKPDTYFNNDPSHISRCYTGKFAGYEASVYVYYIPTSKIVYRAKACIMNESREFTENVYETMEDLIKRKYSDSIIEENEQDGHPSVIALTELGLVGLYRSVFDKSYPTTYMIHVDYEDYNNSRKNTESQLEDI